MTYNDLFDAVLKGRYAAPLPAGSRNEKTIEHEFRRDLVDMLVSEYGLSEGGALLICAKAAASANTPRRSRMAVLLDASSLAQLFVNVKSADDAERDNPGDMAVPAK